MKTYYHSMTAKFAVAALFVALRMGYCHAEAVTDWRTYKATTATTLSGQGTADPILGAIGTTAQASFMLGYLTTPAVLGPNVGDFVRLTFGVSFNDAVGGQGTGDNFRFALFDLNGEAQDSETGDGSGGPNYATAGTAKTDDFRGYWFGNKGGGGAGNNGSIRERNAALTASTNPFSNTASDPAPSLGTVGGVNVPLLPDVNGDGTGGDYVGEMTLTRAAGGLIDLSGKLKNSSDVGNEFDASDTTLNSTSTYGAVAFLNGNGLSFDQAIFINVDVTVGSANLPGDYNGDGGVDAGDYVVWRKTLIGDEDGYQEWVENFGRMQEEEVGAGASLNAITGVPEPAAWGLVAIAALIVFGCGRGRQRPQHARVSC